MLHVHKEHVAASVGLNVIFFLALLGFFLGFFRPYSFTLYCAHSVSPKRSQVKSSRELSQEETLMAYPHPNVSRLLLAKSWGLIFFCTLYNCLCDISVLTWHICLALLFRVCSVFPFPGSIWLLCLRFSCALPKPNDRAGSNSSVGKKDVEQASFLFWRWPGTGPQVRMHMNVIKIDKKRSTLIHSCRQRYVCAQEGKYQHVLNQPKLLKQLNHINN